MNYCKPCGSNSFRNMTKNMEISILGKMHFETFFHQKFKDV